LARKVSENGEYVFSFFDDVCGYTMGFGAGNGVDVCFKFEM